MRGVSDADVARAKERPCPRCGAQARKGCVADTGRPLSFFAVHRVRLRSPLSGVPDCPSPSRWKVGRRTRSGDSWLLVRGSELNRLTELLDAAVDQPNPHKGLVRVLMGFLA